ncbi:hypothetical protein ADIMK_3568 [Marinobacterium lacunae]|uniref:Uncharacterized protein n=1 Tax=Marinobacterium lacunae TaxID=1232683 RepID=A0A081FUS3_9GAMM|nr:hypothetical protein ADIMK_3568 [Marinobacterium lacunae]
MMIFQDYRPSHNGKVKHGFLRRCLVSFITTMPVRFEAIDKQ